MDRAVPVVLIALIVVAALLIIIFVVPVNLSYITTSVGDDEDRDDINKGVIVGSLSGEVSGDYEGLDEDVIYLGSLDSEKCLQTPEQHRARGNCDYPVNLSKKCYRTEKRGCREVMIEVSCFEEVEQVRGKGHCFGVKQFEKTCYESHIKGCRGVLKETSCLEKVRQVHGEGECCFINGVRGSCDYRGQRCGCGGC